MGELQYWARAYANVSPPSRDWREIVAVDVRKCVHCKIALGARAGSLR